MSLEARPVCISELRKKLDHRIKVLEGEGIREEWIYCEISQITALLDLITKMAEALRVGMMIRNDVHPNDYAPLVDAIKEYERMKRPTKLKICRVRFLYSRLCLKMVI